MNNNNLEIERKYLVGTLPANLTEYKSYKIEQAYISRKPTIRIRKRDNEYFLTVKGKGKISKIEYELNITKEEYENLLEKIDGKIIKKTRYIIPIHNNLIAELDVFEDYLDGLIFAEVEFDNKKMCDDFIKPDWFGKDVSLEKGYTNASLSVK